MRGPLAAILALSLATVACADDPAIGQPDQWLFGGDRGVQLRAPEDYDHSQSYPLLIVLHGYKASGLLQLVYSRLDLVVEKYGVLVAAPDGTVDEDGKRFWNATDACCDFWHTGVDDLAYISGLITEISSVWNVDPGRVYLYGHSNGAFMSYQMACHHADKIAAIATLAGATQLERADCQPSELVSVLHLHGDDDPDVAYDGEPLHPSAAGSTAYWAGYNGCSSDRTAYGERLDLDEDVDGAETVTERYTGCPEGIDVELWTLEGSGHVPVHPDAYADYIWNWLDAHGRR